MDSLFVELQDETNALEVNLLFLSFSGFFLTAGGGAFDILPLFCRGGGSVSLAFSTALGPFPLSLDEEEVLGGRPLGLACEGGGKLFPVGLGVGLGALTCSGSDSELLSGENILFFLRGFFSDFASGLDVAAGGLVVAGVRGGGLVGAGGRDGGRELRDVAAGAVLGLEGAEERLFGGGGLVSLLICTSSSLDEAEGFLTGTFTGVLSDLPLGADVFSCTLLLGSTGLAGAVSVLRRGVGRRGGGSGGAAGAAAAGTGALSCGRGDSSLLLLSVSLVLLPEPELLEEPELLLESELEPELDSVLLLVCRIGSSQL